MKNIVVATVMLLSAVSHADVIRCVFTEPFVSTTYNMSKSTLRSDIAGVAKPKIVKNVLFKIKSAGVFELVAKDGTVLQTLTLNNKGSNGMSDAVYPFEVVDRQMMDHGAANNGYGGCESSELKATEPSGEY